jgi:hypothetical protein
MPEVETLVTPELLERKGKWGEWSEPSFPISVSDIRKFAIGCYWPEIPPRLFWDEDFAKTTRWGGIVAPQDFNPFAWPIRQMDQNVTWPGTSQGSHGMNGGQTDTYGVPMRPGDVIRSHSRVKEWTERISRLGLTMFLFTEVEWRNQKDEIVRSRVSTGIRY